MDEVQHLSVRAWVPVSLGFWDVFKRSDGGFETLSKVFGD